MIQIRGRQLVVFLLGIAFLLISTKTGSEEYGIDRLEALDVKSTKIFIRLLSDPLWKQRDAYDAGHYLMIPLHYAARTGNVKLLAAFSHQFARLVSAYKANEVDLGVIDELQYLSLASRYLVLLSSRNRSVDERDIMEVVKRRFLHYWENAPAWHWTEESFPGGVRERLEWKLQKENPRRSYYNVIFDQEMYLIGLAADLLVWSRARGHECEECEEAVQFFDKIIEDRLDKKEKGWVFQKNFWTDHPTYAFSGYLTRPLSQSDPHRAEGTQSDSSHAHRWPLWLLQISGVRSVDQLTNRLRWQLLNKVIDDEQVFGVPVLRNYMSGHNGFYRWQYSTHRDDGYGPYELSGTFSLGWWALLGGNGVARQYGALAEAFPLDSAQMALYRGKSTRDRHSIIRSSYENGLRQGIAAMASRLAEM